MADPSKTGLDMVPRVRVLADPGRHAVKDTDAADDRSALPPGVRELFDGPNTAHVATLMRDGAPHRVPMWVGVEGDRMTASTVARRDAEGCG